jgi:MFS family permease
VKIPALIVLLMLAGFGYGMLNPTSTRAVMSWFPPRQRATAVSRARREP